MTNNQLTHESHHIKAISKEIIMVCDHVKGPANIGAIFRLVDAFQVSKIIFCGSEIDITSNRLKKTARNTHTTIRFRESGNIENTLKELHETSYTSIALEITSESISIQQFNSKELKKLVLIIGDERYGISDNVLTMAHHTVHIPMYGNNSSMNVAQATAIALYALRSE